MNDELITEVATVSGAADSAEQATTEVGIIDELLIEEISIDGMCGVY
jgi:mycofactocin precursor